MKHLFFVLFVSFAFSIYAQQPNIEEVKDGKVFVKNPKSEVKSEEKLVFNEDTHDFGTIPEGPKVNFDFTFTNNFDQPVVLQKVKGSCGCTVPEWQASPILPSDGSNILVTYNTSKRPGNFTKSVTINYMVGDNEELLTKVIYIKGKVEPLPKEESMPVKKPSIMDIGE